MNRTSDNPPRWAWAGVALWIVLWIAGPLVPHLLGGHDDTGERGLDILLLSTALSALAALVLGAVLGHVQSWNAFVATVAAALGSSPVVAILIMDVNGGAFAVFGAFIMAVVMALLLGVLPLSVGVTAASLVRMIRTPRTAPPAWNH